MSFINFRQLLPQLYHNYQLFLHFKMNTILLRHKDRSLIHLHHHHYQQEHHPHNQSHLCRIDMEYTKDII